MKMAFNMLRTSPLLNENNEMPLINAKVGDRNDFEKKKFAFGDIKNCGPQLPAAEPQSMKKPINYDLGSETISSMPVDYKGAWMRSLVLSDDEINLMISRAMNEFRYGYDSDDIRPPPPPIDDDRFMQAMPNKEDSLPDFMTTLPPLPPFDDEHSSICDISMANDSASDIDRDLPGLQHSVLELSDFDINFSDDDDERMESGRGRLLLF